VHPDPTGTPPGPGVCRVPMTIVRLQGLTRSYQEGGREHIVLLDASLELAAGESVALLGPSGSGKSTLLNLMSGMDTPDAGRVEVAGTDLTGLNERDRTLFRRRHIGFVFQFFNLIPTLSVEENLLLPLELAGRIDAEHEARALDLLRIVGLAGREGAFPDRLSGGEQQRVAVARALVHRPALVLADEPTGNLDREAGDVVLDLLDSLVREEGATLMTVTHSQRVAERADRVLVLRDGRVEEA
jgi:putative ABC transport system ATP-binding protein